MGFTELKEKIKAALLQIPVKNAMRCVQYSNCSKKYIQCGNTCFIIYFFGC